MPSPLLDALAFARCPRAYVSLDTYKCAASERVSAPPTRGALAYVLYKWRHTCSLHDKYKCAASRGGVGGALACALAAHFFVEPGLPRGWNTERSL